MNKEEFLIESIKLYLSIIISPIIRGLFFLIKLNILSMSLSEYFFFRLSIMGYLFILNSFKV